MTGLWKPSQQLGAETLGFTRTNSPLKTLPLPSVGETRILLHHLSEVSFLSILLFMKDIKITYTLTENPNLLVNRSRTFAWGESDGLIWQQGLPDNTLRNQEGINRMNFFRSPTPQVKLVTAPWNRRKYWQAAEISLSPNLDLAASLQNKP